MATARTYEVALQVTRRFSVLTKGYELDAPGADKIARDAAKKNGKTLLSLTFTGDIIIAKMKDNPAADIPRLMDAGSKVAQGEEVLGFVSSSNTQPEIRQVFWPVFFVVAASIFIGLVLVNWTIVAVQEIGSSLADFLSDDLQGIVVKALIGYALFEVLRAIFRSRRT